MALETLDNQIDFNYLDIIRRPPGEFDYAFKQYREIVSRPEKLDAVQKFSYSIDRNGFMYACALRKSGSVDIYFNG